MKLRNLVHIAMIILPVITSCNSQKQQPTLTNNNWNNDSAQAIRITDVTTILPQAGDVELVETYCVPCHSLRYIQIQPEFSYKAWEKLVDKMITVYGAPVRDSATRESIINYLYAIKGKKEKPGSGH